MRLTDQLERQIAFEEGVQAPVTLRGFRKVSSARSYEAYFSFFVHGYLHAG